MRLQHAVKGVFNRFIVYPILRCILMNPATPVSAIEEHHLTEAGRRFLAAVGTGYWLSPSAASISSQRRLGQVRSEPSAAIKRPTGAGYEFLISTTHATGPPSGPIDQWPRCRAVSQ